MMNDIASVYNKSTYLPFLKFCQQRHFKTMEDLARCPFQLLTKEPGITPLLASRVRAVYASYCKTRMTPEQAAAALRARESREAAPAAQKALTGPELVIWLRHYFEGNPERLITAEDAFKAANGRAKKAEINRILQDVAWCRTVGKGTYFYSPVK